MKAIHACAHLHTHTHTHTHARARQVCCNRKNVAATCPCTRAKRVAYYVPGSRGLLTFAILRTGLRYCRPAILVYLNLHDPPTLRCTERFLRGIVASWCNLIAGANIGMYDVSRDSHWWYLPEAMRVELIREL